MQFPDPFDDEGLMFDFDDPFTCLLVLAILLLVWILICPFTVP